jgi:hypothetical protein
MDITIHPVSAVTQAHQAPTVKTPVTDSIPASVYTQSSVGSVSAPAHTTAPVTTSSDTEAYQAAARQAELSFKNVYALGDQQFSIFKDATGKYITRYVSLRDGKVTYTPAPSFVKPPTINPGHVAISA